MGRYADVVIADAPHHYYHMDYPTVPTDVMGNEPPGTWNGSPLPGGSLVTGEIDGSADLNGTDAFANITFDSAAITPPYTFECWVYLDAVSTQQTLFTRSGSVAAFIDGTSITIGSTTGDTNFGSGTFAANTRYHIVLEWRTTTELRWWVNGTERSGPDAVGVAGTTAGGGWLGGVAGPARVLNGRLDEVAFYPYLLSEDQIQEHYALGTGQFGRSLYVREKPPVRLSVEAETPAGRRYRWGQDERTPEQTLNDLTFSTTMPGGFEQMGGVLPRDPSVDYTDMDRLTTLRVISPASCRPFAGEFRLERAPQTSGNEFQLAPDAAGWANELEDNNAIKEIYIDCDFSKWEGMSVTRKLALLAATIDFTDGQTVVDSATGEPALELAFEGSWSRTSAQEMHFDAQGVAIGSLYYAWKKGPTVLTADAWTWAAHLFTNDAITGGSDATGNLKAAGPGTGTLTATATTRGVALVQLLYTGAAGADGLRYPIYWTALAVYGRHGLTKRGTATATQAQGLLGSDIVQHAVNNYTTLTTIVEQGSFVVQQASYLEPTSTKGIIEDVDKYVLSDWGVWDNRTFYYNRRGGGLSRTWKARAAASGLEATGPQVDRLWNSVVVQYQDVTGESRTVGPTGSGANTISTLLEDTSKDNPLNQIGVQRRQLLTMELSTPAGAIEVGRRFLEEQKLLDTAGRAKLTGYVLDQAGILWPAHNVRAGDLIEFIDARDPSPRRVTKTSYSDDEKAVSVDLDSPPEGLKMVLERLGASVANIGSN